MTEQIAEFAEQCYHLYGEHHIDLEKFAELIVRECAMICEQQRIKILNNPDDPSWTEHLTECQVTMKQHFGVTE